MTGAVHMETWRQADRVLSELLEYEPHERAEELASLDLPAEVRQCVTRLLAASEATGPLDTELRVGAATPEPGSLAGTLFGNWRLTGEIGRGGMAVVYRAEREGASFDQVSAIKLLPRGMAGHERFLTEQQVLAGLEHPNIARMLDGGVEPDGTPWLAMELVDGQPIDKHCEAQEPRAVARLFLQVIEAVNFAHQRLVIHRDLKPGNILVDASGRARLLDFGIARMLSDESATAATRVLTAEYGAPEQLSGGVISTATDVYGLGAVLFKLLTDEAPRARDGSRSDALGATGLDRDLRNIVRKALREEPADRYPTAQALKDDLERWLGGYPVVASQGTRRYRARKWLQRHRLGASLGALALAGLIATTATALWQARETRRQLEIAEATTRFLVKLFEEADPVVAQGRPTTARELLERAERTLAGITEPGIRDALLIAMARAHFGMADFAQAQSLLGERLAMPVNGQPLEIRLLYAESAHGAGNGAQAIHFLERLPEPGRSSIAVRRLLGRYLSAEAEYAKADTELEAARARLDRDTEPEAATSLWVAIATNHVNQGRYEDALAALDQAQPLAATQSLWRLGAEVEQLYGEVARIQGRHQDALDRFRAARALYGRAYGEDHSIMIDMAKFEAQELGELGQPEEAVKRLEEAAALARGRLGDAPLTVNVLNALSIARDGAGDLNGAIEAGHEAEAVMLRRGDDAHPLRANLLGNIASYNIDLGRLDEAEALGRQAEDILRAALPPDHPVFIHTQFQLARIRGRQNRPAAALEILQSLIGKAMESPGPGNHLTIAIMRDLGRQQLRLGNPEQALEWLQRAADAVRDYPKDILFETYVALTHIEALLANDETESARAILEPLTERMGHASSNPDGQTVLVEALMAFHLAERERASDLLAQARELMAAQPDGGLAYRPEVEALEARL